MDDGTTETPLPGSELDRLVLECLDLPPARRPAFVERLCRDRPEHAAGLRRRLALLQDGGFIESAASVPEHGAPVRLGCYRILERIGGGGMGVVYLAEDEQLGRRVAVKVIHPDRALIPSVRARFEREARVVARLDHPSICPLYEFGEQDGVPFLVMRFVEGTTLAARIAAARADPDGGLPVVAGTPGNAGSGSTSTTSGGATQRASVHGVIRAIEDVARALHTVHELGLVHRDVKPHNIVMTPEGRPVVLDFGLAREDAETLRSLTQPGERLGTPAYMAPEQIAASRGPVDRRTDVYALGVTLYECLTLRVPFVADDREGLYREILAGATRTVRTHCRSLPRDLETVVDKAMDVDPRRRYQTALDLAEDLRRVRSFEPIVARRAGPWLRTVRWSQRNPVAATVLAFLASSLLVTFALLQRVRREQEATARALDGARAQGLARAAGEVLATNATLGLLLAREALRADPALEPSPEIVSALQAAVAAASEEAVFRFGATVHVASFSADGRRLVIGAPDHVARVWELRDSIWRPTIELRGHTATISAVGFAPHRADRILTTALDGSTRVWDVDTGDCVVVLSVHTTTGEGISATRTGMGWGGGPAWVLGARFSPDGGRIVTYGDPAAVRLWRREGEAWRDRPLPGHRDWVGSAAFSPDGDLLATATGYGDYRNATDDCSVRLWSRDGELVATLGGEHASHLTSVAFSPDGRLLLTASHDRTARLWDVASRRCLETLRHDGPVHSAVFAPDGRRVLTGAFDATARVFALDGTLVEKLHHDGRVRVAGFSPDGLMIAVAGQSAGLRCFGPGGAEVALLTGHSHQLTGFEFDPGGGRIVTTSHDGTARLWRLSWADLPTLRGHRDAVHDVKVSADGRRICTASRDGTIRWWSADDGRALGAPVEIGVPAYSVWPYDDGGSLLVQTLDGALVQHRSGSAPRVLEVLEGRVESFALAPGGVLAIAGCLDGHAYLLDLATEETRPLGERHGQRVQSTQFSADGRRAVVGAWDGIVTVWDVATRSKLAEFPDDPVPGELVNVRLSADGRRLAVAETQQRVRIYDVDRRVELGALELDRTVHVMLSPDGRMLVTAGNDAVRVYELPDEPGGPIVHRMDLRGHRGWVLRMEFGPDGRLLYTAGADGVVRTWPLRVVGLVAAADRRAFRELTERERQRYQKLLERR